MKNRYAKRSKISEPKFRQLVRLFVLNLEATSRGYNGLVDVGYGKHLRVDHGRNEFARVKAHINGIEGFWGFAKSRLTRFRGVSQATFFLHLKECEFRFNYGDQNMYRVILKIIRENPLF